MPRFVRGTRFSAKNRILRCLALVMLKSHEVKDASPTNSALMTLQRWMERIAEK
jgi:hypothetical protein